MQAEVWIERYYHLSQAEMDALSDAEFFSLAGKAWFLREQEVETVKMGVLRALEEAFRQ